MRGRKSSRGVEKGPPGRPVAGRPRHASVPPKKAPAKRRRPRREIIQPDGVHRTPSYVHAIRVENTLYVAGQVARDVNGDLVGAGDAAAQARQVYKNVEAILKAAGASWRDVVKVTTYLVDRADSPAVSAVRFEHFGDQRPPHTAVIVAGLGSAEVLVEVDIIAVLSS
jgi:2-iminobutanoate/2-iminopropanoate deaminase